MDFEDEKDMVQMARLGIALQPIATALFANSPFRNGEPTGYLSWRSHVWTDTVGGCISEPQQGGCTLKDRWHQLKEGSSVLHLNECRMQLQPGLAPAVLQASMLLAGDSVSTTHSTHRTGLCAGQCEQRNLFMAE